jgi:hypothetical protein
VDTVACIEAWQGWRWTGSEHLAAITLLVSYRPLARDLKPRFFVPEWTFAREAMNALSQSLEYMCYRVPSPPSPRGAGRRKKPPSGQSSRPKPGDHHHASTSGHGYVLPAYLPWIGARCSEMAGPARRTEAIVFTFSAFLWGFPQSFPIRQAEPIRRAEDSRTCPPLLLSSVLNVLENFPKP